MSNYRVLLLRVESPKPIYWSVFATNIFFLLKVFALYPNNNNNNSFICMTITYYSIAKAYNSTKRTDNVIII